MKKYVAIILLIICYLLSVVGCENHPDVYIEPFTEPYINGDIRDVYLEFNAVNKTNEDYLVEFTLVVKGNNDDGNFEHIIPNIFTVAFANSTTGYMVMEYTSKKGFNRKMVQMYDEKLCQSISVTNLKIVKASERQELIKYTHFDGQIEYNTVGVYRLDAINRNSSWTNSNSK